MALSLEDYQNWKATVPFNPVHVYQEGRIEYHLGPIPIVKARLRPNYKVGQRQSEVRLWFKSLPINHFGCLWSRKTFKNNLDILQ